VKNTDSDLHADPADMIEKKIYIPEKFRYWVPFDPVDIIFKNKCLNYYMLYNYHLNGIMTH